MLDHDVEVVVGVDDVVLGVVVVVGTFLEEVVAHVVGRIFELVTVSPQEVVGVVLVVVGLDLRVVGEQAEVISVLLEGGRVSEKGFGCQPPLPVGQLSILRPLGTTVMETLVVTVSTDVEVMVDWGPVDVERIVDVVAVVVSEVTAGAVEISVSVKESVSVSVAGMVDGGTSEVVVTVLAGRVIIMVVVEAGRSVVRSLVGPGTVTVTVVEAAGTVEVILDVPPAMYSTGY